MSSELGNAVLENWQSEYLQFTRYILATVWLLQRGSPESKELDQAGGSPTSARRSGGTRARLAGVEARGRDPRRQRQDRLSTDAGPSMFTDRRVG